MVKHKKANSLTFTPRFKAGDLVMVWWGDAYEHIGRNYKLKYKTHLTQTVGFIQEIDKERIYLSMFLCGIARKLQSPYVAIPKGMIEKVSVIKIKKG